MTTVTAHLRNLRQSPRKVRLVTQLVKGRRADDAVDVLRFTTKRAARPVRKLIESAQANARDKQLSEDLVVKTITVSEGKTLFRARPAAQGQAKRIRKRTSHISVVLEEQPEKATIKNQNAKTTNKTPAGSTA